MYYELRDLPDRRRRPTPMVSRYSFRGRRRNLARRSDDLRSGYVDRIGPRLVLVLAAVFVFHVLDAVFTLMHLQAGARELNPLMRALIDQHEWLFLSVKLGLAGLGLLFLGIHQHFPHVRKAVALLFIVFGLLVGYHLAVFAAG
ncbi:MAG: DUF5658 family protein [Candidatus Eisenbacteria bacterium]